MDRRDFSKGLLLSGVAAPMILRPSPSQSFIANNDKGHQGEGGVDQSLARIQLQIGTSIIVLTYLIMLLGNSPFGYNLGSPVKRFSANRADTSNIPILGDLTRQTLASQFRNAPVVATMYLINTMLILVPLAASMQRPKKTLLTHRDYEYEVPGRPKPLSLSTPIIGDSFRRSDAIGTARQRNSELLILIKPHLAMEGS
ncbi:MULTISPECIES: hypothetical protein [Halocynthiibacter]|uniref:Uncharacterized protein n=1 Tax=Halocynthiibacter halioticoli TaxID=2986804 RepID=A0AAE3LPW5_9RHOB|nr:MULTISPECIES: hypothetical protein [Halocynthiibacter]MCV6823872.1 hypothetical protein [Halocynthiibacter halioticoli]MCW4056873.1 hypothetical protein [Halocynthiibacter sp. SDUM655004]